MEVLNYASHFARFPELFGLDVPSRVLWDSLERDQLAGAYVLRGPTGVGKTTLAVAFAQAAACQAPARNPYRACETCDSCRRIAGGVQPEIALIQPAGDQTQIWQLWDRERRPPGVLERTLPFPPTIGKKRVYIFERADTLNPAAANSLLKVLEEPPPYAVFLLLTPGAERLLPTILSRCQIVAVKPTEAAKLEEWLVERHQVSPERAGIIAALAEGLPGTALRLARNAAMMADVERCTAIAIRLARTRPLGALRVAEELRALAGSMKPIRAVSEPETESGGEDGGSPRSRVDRGGLGMVLDIVITVFRDLLLLSLDPGSRAVVHRNQLSDLRQCAARASSDHWLGSLEILAEARRRLDQNVQPQIITDWVATAIATATTRERRRTYAGAETR